MNRPKATQIYGAFVLVVSCYWVWGLAISPLIRWIGNLAKSADDAGSGSYWSIEWLLMFGRLGILAVVAVMIYCGIGLVKNRSLPAWTGAEDFPEEERWRGWIVVDPIVTYVRFSLAIYTMIGVVLAPAMFGENFLSAVPESIRWSVSLFVFVPVALLIYTAVVRWLLLGRGYRDFELRYIIGKGAVALIAYLFWILSSDFVRLFLPESSVDPPGRGLEDSLLNSMAALLGPILAAMLFYQITLHLMRYQQIDLDLRRAGLRPMGGSEKKG